MKKLIIFLVCSSLLITSCSSNKRYPQYSLKDLPPITSKRDYKKKLVFNSQNTKIKKIPPKKRNETNWGTGIIMAYDVNIRSGPSEKNYVITQYNKYKKVLIIEEKLGWLKIQVGRHKTGWIWSAYVKKDGETVNTIRHKGDLLVMTDDTHCIGPDGTQYVLRNKTQSHKKKNPRFISFSCKICSV